MTTPRIAWTDLPLVVCDWVEDVLGSRVVSWRSQAGGWSPGTADRLVCEDGSRAFLKAAHPGLNPMTPELYRAEARVTPLLGPGVPCAHPIATFDDGDWVALLLEDIEGRHPLVPWREDELRAVLRALDEVAAATTPVTDPAIPSGSAEHADLFAGFARLRDDPCPDLNPWVGDNLDHLVDLAARGVEVVDGASLGHGDLRADNMLVEPSGRVRIVDWPSACRSVPWADGVGLAVNIEQHGGLLAEDGAQVDHVALLGSWAGSHGASREDVTAYLAGMAAYFTDVARRPAPVGLPTIREHQGLARDAALRVLRQRLD